MLKHTRPSPPIASCPACSRTEERPCYLGSWTPLYLLLYVVVFSIIINFVFYGWMLQWRRSIRPGLGSAARQGGRRKRGIRSSAASSSVNIGWVACAPGRHSTKGGLQHPATWRRVCVKPKLEADGDSAEESGQRWCIAAECRHWPVRWCCEYDTVLRTICRLHLLLARPPQAKAFCYWAHCLSHNQTTVCVCVGTRPSCVWLAVFVQFILVWLTTLHLPPNLQNMF